jgi:hypothetical protein
MLFRKILFILFLLVSVLLGAQNSSVLLTNNNQKINSTSQTQSINTCSSPNGNMNSISSPPANYNALQTGGYCNPASYGKSGTICWTFTPITDSVVINSGYATTNCSIFYCNINFSSFNLYTCSPACIFIGTGLNYTVTPGQCYTWCMTYSVSAGAGFCASSCAFSDFCPYYITSNSILPVELLYFAGTNQDKYNILQWETITETNNKDFIIDISKDGINWALLNEIKGAGTSISIKKYRYLDTKFNEGINYYRLKQIDFNGQITYFGIIAINNLNIEISKLIRITNLLGQEVDVDSPGLKFLYYSDGSVIKKIN